MLKKVFLGLVVFLVLVLVFHSFIIGTIVKPQVERQASKMLGTSVKISVLSVRLWPGSAAVYGLKIKNPTGFSDENLLDLGSFSIALDLPGLMKEFAATHVGPQFIVVDHVKVKNLKFLFERGPKTDSGAQSNVEKLVENLNAQSESTKGSTESTKTPETAKKPIDLKIHLKLFSFIDGKVTARDAQTGSGFEYVVDKINVNVFFNGIFFDVFENILPNFTG